jgi:hypothetical protein
MTPMIAEGGFTRRELLKGGAVATLLLGAGGWIAARITDGHPQALAPLKHLGAAEQLMLARVADVALGEVLPSDQAARNEWLTRIVQNADAGISALPLHLQEDTKKLTSMLAFAPTRLLLIGQWTGWQSVSREALQERLEALRSSGNETRHAIYRVLRDMTLAAFYGDRRSWPLIGYAGPVVNRIENG